MKSHPDPVILEASAPGVDDILERDLAFHLGDRETFDFNALAAVCAARSAPDDTFVCFRIKPPEFLAGEFYQRNCSIASSAVSVSTPASTSKQSRTISTINRDLADMHPHVPHAFDLRDASDHDYAAIFGTERPIPVFQYHRRRGLAAIIHPLPARHDYPSPNIPEFRDTKTFREKRPRMFWRGNLSGKVGTRRGEMSIVRLLESKKIPDRKKLIHLQQSLRYRLCKMGSANDALDAGLSIDWDAANSQGPIPGLAALCRPRATIEEHLEHRYLLALDGYDGPSSHYWMLGSNSLVLRQESAWEMFGDSYFQPWVHYAPIAADGSDVMDVFEWCERHTDACETMVANARRAWSLLFNASYQRERRRALFKRYAQWASPQ